MAAKTAERLNESYEDLILNTVMQSIENHPEVINISMEIDQMSPKNMQYSPKKKALDISLF